MSKTLEEVQLWGKFAGWPARIGTHGVGAVELVEGREHPLELNTCKVVHTTCEEAGMLPDASVIHYTCTKPLAPRKV